MPIIATKSWREPSAEALIKRINRKLARHFWAVRVSRGVRMRAEVGTYYLLDFDHGLVLRDHLDLVEFAREIGL